MYLTEKDVRAILSYSAQGQPFETCIKWALTNGTKTNPFFIEILKIPLISEDMLVINLSKYAELINEIVYQIGDMKNLGYRFERMVINPNINQNEYLMGFIDVEDNSGAVQIKEDISTGMIHEEFLSEIYICFHSDNNITFIMQGIESEKINLDYLYDNSKQIKLARLAKTQTGS